VFVINSSSVEKSKMSEEKNPGGHPGDEEPGSPHEAHHSIQPELEAPEHTTEELQKTKRRRRRNLLIVGALVVLALFLIYHFSRSGPSGGTAAGPRGAGLAPAAITVGQSRIGDINIYVDALGTVTPTYTVTVYSQITGRVMAVHYREGQMVRKGDALIDIDPRPYQATLTQAEGNLEHDQGVLAQARIDLERYKQAYARNAIAKQQLDDQEQAVVQSEGTVKADQGTVVYDQVQLEYCHIVAPISGQVGLRLVDAGNTVFSGSSSVLVVITQMQPITVVFNVPEDNLPQVQSQLGGGHKLLVDALSRSDKKLLDSGTLTALDNQVDTTTGTIKFRAEFPNKHFALFPNQFVNARMLVNTLRGVTLVPSAAVQRNGTNAFVYIVQADNTVTVQPVTVLAENEQDTAVQGLNPGVNLATSGFDRLDNGTKVSVRGQSTQGQGSNAAESGGTAPTNGPPAPYRGPAPIGGSAPSSGAPSSSPAPTTGSNPSTRAAPSSGGTAK
jgi:multidrug efflux system membrane fusion protein